MISTLFLIVILFTRALLAVLLVTAGAAKLADTQGFARTLVGLGLSLGHHSLVRGLALAIPLLELGLGIGLISGLYPEVMDSAALAIFACFTLVVLISVLRTNSVTCRCFGALSDTQFTGWGLLRNIVYTGLALLVMVYGSRVHEPFDGPPIFIALLVCCNCCTKVDVEAEMRRLAELESKMPVGV